MTQLLSYNRSQHFSGRMRNVEELAGLVASIQPEFSQGQPEVYLLEWPIQWVRLHVFGTWARQVDNRHQEEPLITSEQAVRLCDRNFGIGGDGVTLCPRPLVPMGLGFKV